MDTNNTNVPTLPPTVTGMTPASGPYGTEVEITGANFGMDGAAIFGQGSGDLDLWLDSWSDTRITARVPFPGNGAITVATRAGTATAGTFTAISSWTAGPGFDATTLVQARAMSTGVLGALYRTTVINDQDEREPSLAVFGGANAGAYPLTAVVDPMDATAVVPASLVEADDHTPEVIATAQSGEVYAYTVQNAALVSTDTGIAGTVVAAARDQNGVYAWILTAQGLVRARPGATWTVDRGPIAPPASQPLDGEVAADGTLWVVFSEPNLDPFDHEGYVSLQSLAPAATQLTAIERADPNSYDDVISQAQLVLAADGVHMVVTGLHDNGGTEQYFTPRLRTAAGTWSDAPTTDGLVQYAFVGTTLAGVVNDVSMQSTSLVPDLTTPTATQVLPVWPTSSEGVITDATGQLRPFLTSGEVAYSPTPPPS